MVQFVPVTHLRQGSASFLLLFQSEHLLSQLCLMSQCHTLSAASPFSFPSAFLLWVQLMVGAWVMCLDPDL